MTDCSQLKILFLDIDGCLNSKQECRYTQRLNQKRSMVDSMCPIACSNLQWLIESEPNLRIVISSTWRYLGLPVVRQTLSQYHVDVSRIIGKTPYKRGAKPDGTRVYPKLSDPIARGYEIQYWLNKHPHIKQFCILDDSEDMKHLEPYRVRTSWTEGLMFGKMVEVALKLNIKLRVL